MTDPKDVSTKTLEEIHRRPLTKDEQFTVDEIRRNISSTIAWWVETQFRLGNTRLEIWTKLGDLRVFVAGGSAPMDSAGVDLTTTEAFEGERAAYEEDFSTHRNPDR